MSCSVVVPSVLTRLPRVPLVFSHRDPNTHKPPTNTHIYWQIKINNNKKTAWQTLKVSWSAQLCSLPVCHFLVILCIYSVCIPLFVIPSVSSAGVPHVSPGLRFSSMFQVSCLASQYRLLIFFLVVSPQVNSLGNVFTSTLPFQSHIITSSRPLTSTYATSTIFSLFPPSMVLWSIALSLLWLIIVILFCLPNKSLHKLQVLQNPAAWIITRTSPMFSSSFTGCP